MRNLTKKAGTGVTRIKKVEAPKKRTGSTGLKQIDDTDLKNSIDAAINTSNSEKAHSTVPAAKATRGPKTRVAQPALVTPKVRKPRVAAAKKTEPAKARMGKKNGSTKQSKRSDNRHLIVEMSPEGKLQNVYLDLGHAAKDKGLNAKDIKKDMIANTTNTGVWLRIPAGDKINIEDITARAQEYFVERTNKKSKGRYGDIDRNAISETIKAFDVNSVDNKTLRQIEKLLNKSHS